MDKVYERWMAGNNGSGMMLWFVYRVVKWTEDGIPRSRREVAMNHDGSIRRFATMDAAFRFALELNTPE